VLGCDIETLIPLLRVCQVNLVEHLDRRIFCAKQLLALSASRTRKLARSTKVVRLTPRRSKIVERLFLIERIWVLDNSQLAL